MYEYKQSVTAWAPVRITDSLGNPVTGVVFGAVTAAVIKSDTTVTAFAVTGADWFEATTSAFASQGVYTIRLPASVLSLPGMLTYAVSSGGAGLTYVGSIKVVAYEEVSPAAIADTVWSVGLASFAEYPLSTGAKLYNLELLTQEGIVGAVWDVNLPSHLFADTTGAKLNEGSGGGGSGVSFLSNGDTVNPIIIQVSTPKHTQVKVTFSEPVVMTTDANGALNPANYSIPGVTVIAVSSLTSQQVLITTSAQTPNFLYTLTITNVEDLVGNPIL